MHQCAHKVLHSIFIGYYRSLRKLVLILCKSVEHFNETKHQSLKLLTQSKYKKECLNEIKKKPGMTLTCDVAQFL